MKKYFKLEWFNLENYKKCNELNPKQWSDEILNRLIANHYLFQKESNLNNLHSENSLKIIEHIKRFGLINNQKASETAQIYTLNQKPDTYIKNISAYDAFGFLYHSYKKETFTVDMQKIDDLTKKNKHDHEFLKDISEKYSMPISLERLENLNQANILHNRPMECDEGDRFLAVDLNAPDEVLVSDFKEWLHKERVGYEYKYPTKNISDAEIKSWCKNQLLAYWDLSTACELEHINLSSNQLGNLLFPEEYDVDLSERIRKVIKVKIKKVFTDETCEVLSAMS